MTSFHIKDQITTGRWYKPKRCDSIGFYLSLSSFISSLYINTTHFQEPDHAQERQPPRSVIQCFPLQHTQPINNTFPGYSSANEGPNQNQTMINTRCMISSQCSSLCHNNLQSSNILFKPSLREDNVRDHVEQIDDRQNKNERDVNARKCF